MGHRFWAILCHERRLTAQATVLRILSEEGLNLSPRCQAERRQLAQAGKVAFTELLTVPNRAWRLDFTEIETGTWRIAACRAAGRIASWVAHLPDREPARGDRCGRARDRRGRELSGLHAAGVEAESRTGEFVGQ